MLIGQKKVVILGRSPPFFTHWFMKLYVSQLRPSHPSQDLNAIQSFFFYKKLPINRQLNDGSGHNQSVGEVKSFSSSLEFSKWNTSSRAKEIGLLSEPVGINLFISFHQS